MASSSDNPTAGERKLLRCWIGVCALVAILFCGSQLAEIPVRSALRGYDNTFNYLWLRSAMVDRDWDFRNDLEHCNTLDSAYRASALALPVTPIGRIPNKYGIGWALLTTPFFLIADAIVTLGRSAGVWTYANDGFNPVYQYCIQLGHAALGILALWLAVRTVTVWTEDRFAALSGVVLVWSASSLIYYQSVNVSMSHGAAFLTVSVMAFAICRARRDVTHRRWWIIAGAAFGLAVTVRFQLVLFGLPLVAAMIFDHRTMTEILRRAAWAAVGAVPFLVLQCWAWRSVYGQWLVFGYGREGEVFQWGHPALIDSLFSPWHGLFYWHPLVLIASAGALLWAWSKPREGFTWIAALALTFYLNAAWWCWWFASSFGHRGYDAALLPMMAGAAWLIHRLQGRLRAGFWCLALLLGVWNFYVLLLYRSGAISRSDPVTWIEMIRAGAELKNAVRFWSGILR